MEGRRKGGGVAGEDGRAEWTGIGEGSWEVLGMLLLQTKPIAMVEKCLCGTRFAFLINAQSLRIRKGI